MKSTLGQKLAALRKADGITQADAAAAVGIARSTLASIESGKDNPGRDTLVALATYYKVSLDYLTGHGAEAGGLQPGGYSSENDESFLLIKRIWPALSPDQRWAMARAADALTAPRRDVK
jgi:transcriptional regulator with XRE-family HTH domain